VEIQVSKERLFSAQSQGLLEPLYEYLSSEIDRLSSSVPIRGPEWPLMVAERQGALAAVVKINEWVRGMASPDDQVQTNSPEGA